MNLKLKVRASILSENLRIMNRFVETMGMKRSDSDKQK